MIFFYLNPSLDCLSLILWSIQHDYRSKGLRSSGNRIKGITIVKAKNFQLYNRRTTIEQNFNKISIVRVDMRFNYPENAKQWDKILLMDIVLQSCTDTIVTRCDTVSLYLLTSHPVPHSLVVVITVLCMLLFRNFLSSCQHSTKQ